MRRLHVDDLVYQVATLVLSFLIVHVPYTLVVRPNARAVLEEQARAGMTVLVVTHNREIARVADRVIELSSGKIVSDGPPPGGKADIGDLQW